MFLGKSSLEIIKDEFSAVNQRYISLLSGKEDIHSMDKMTSVAVVEV